MPAMDHPQGAMRDVIEWDTGKFLCKIPEVRHTFSVVGNMNEYQVAIGETTYGGREELCTQPGAVMDYGSLMYITLTRAKSAREAIHIMAKFVDLYGYCSEGESFSVSDANEVWFVDLIGKGRTYLITKKSIEQLTKDNLPVDVLKSVKTLTGKSFTHTKDFNEELKKLIGESNMKNFGGKIADAAENTIKGAVWVARRLPDGYISAHANQARIRQFPQNDTMNTLYAKDVISFARERGYFKGEDKDFSFVDAYAPLTYEALRFCESRVYSFFNRAAPSMKMSMDYVKGVEGAEPMPLWIKPDKKLTAQDIMKLMRDHFEGTDFDMTKDVGAGPFKCPYRWRPMTWSVDGAEYVHERAVSTQQTGFSFIAQSRNWLPNPIGGINWFGVDDTYSTVYVPMYCGITQVPQSYQQGNGSMLEFTWNSAWWVFNLVANWAYTRYSDMIVDIQKVQSELEGKFASYTPVIDESATKLYKADPKLGIQFITEYSVSQGELTVNRWRELGEYLFVKYKDGNVMQEKDGKFLTNGYTQPANPNHPQYPDDWYRKIVKDKGDILKAHKMKSEETH
ncbi:MAG: C69 family dipeptidase [Bacteroidia bacterium]|nr:C69 family dipeptidase [Bacteroidia bacterium]